MSLQAFTCIMTQLDMYERYGKKIKAKTTEKH